jgi:hypothetical protein
VRVVNGTRTEVTTTTVVWELPNPCNWSDLRKVFAVAEQELGENAQWDDEVEVFGADDKLCVRYDAARVTTPLLPTRPSETP